MQSGTGPTRVDHRDRDLHRSFGNISQPFPAEFFTDVTGDMPDQEAEGQPKGCTNYTQASLATNLTKGATRYTAEQLEAVTHANAQGGYDIRQSLMVVKKLGWIKNFYQVRGSGILDSFDAFRLAQISGLPENRSMSLGTPWFPSWEAAINGTLIHREADGSFTYMQNPAGKQIVMPMPQDAELALVRRDPNVLPWHNSQLDGWTQKHGPITYRDKSWQGPNIGEGGYVHFPREVINVVMALSGTVCFTGTNQVPEIVETIDVNAVQWITSFILNLISSILPKSS